jgi:hypothetical protein
VIEQGGATVAAPLLNSSDESRLGVNGIRMVINRSSSIQSMCVLPQTHDAKAKPLDAQSLLIASGLLDMLVESSSGSSGSSGGGERRRRSRGTLGVT